MSERRNSWSKIAPDFRPEAVTSQAISAVVYQDLESILRAGEAVDPVAMKNQMHNITSELSADSKVPRSESIEPKRSGVILFSAVNNDGGIIFEGPFNKTVLNAKKADESTRVFPKLDNHGNFVRYKRQGMIGNQNRVAVKFIVPSLEEFNTWDEERIKKLAESAKLPAQKKVLMEKLFVFQEPDGTAKQVGFYERSYSKKRVNSTDTEKPEVLQLTYDQR